MDAVENDGEFVSLSKKSPGQKVFREIISQSLNDVEYEDDHVARWRPIRFNEIVIDPSRYFGTPLVDEFGISTKLLFDEYGTFNDVGYLAKIYEMPRNLINQAINFEKRLVSLQNGSNGQGSI